MIVSAALRDWMKRLAALLLALVLLAGGSVVLAEEDSPYRTLKKDDSGADVLELKERMYYLGYFNTLKLSDVYNNTMIERVKMLQKNNGLEQTGIATPELQELIFSDACVWQGPTPVPTPVPTPTPPPQGPSDSVKLPELNEDGFLPEGEEPFVYENAEEGHWIYISSDINIEVKQYSTSKPLMLWYETRIRLKEGKKLQSLLVPGKNFSSFKQPAEILKQYTDDDHTVVLAFSDDFFAYRKKYSGVRIGVIIRDGKILFDDPAVANSTKFPPNEILAVFPDGTLKTFESDEHRAQEYLDMGVTDTYSFGPILMQNGKLSSQVKAYDSKDTEPRTALGMIAPNDYIVLTVTGRRDDSKGASFRWMADRMLDLGAVEAINLDGGNTCSLLFMGKLINRAADIKSGNIRYVSGLIGVVEEK